MKTDKPFVDCPTCGAPARVIGPNEIEPEVCKFCHTDLRDRLKEVNEELHELRVLSFLTEFFEKPKLITPQELADFLDCSSEQVRLLAQKGKLGCVILSDEPSANVHRRFLPVHVLEFIENEAISKKSNQISQ